MSDFKEVSAIDVEVGDIIHRRGEPYLVWKIVPGEKAQTVRLFLMGKDRTSSDSVTWFVYVQVLIVKPKYGRPYLEQIGVFLPDQEPVVEEAIEAQKPYREQIARMSLLSYSSFAMAGVLILAGIMVGVLL